jgi:hypothetical protein
MADEDDIPALGLALEPLEKVAHSLVDLVERSSPSGRAAASTT